MNVCSCNRILSNLKNGDAIFCAMDVYERHFFSESNESDTAGNMAYDLKYNQIIKSQMHWNWNGAQQGHGLEEDRIFR